MLLTIIRIPGDTILIFVYYVLMKNFDSLVRLHEQFLTCTHLNHLKNEVLDCISLLRQRAEKRIERIIANLRSGKMLF
ncbi:hypothetical protein KsCSTR_25730 [Candidatus Kuenenia stuttgartiensis]|jgi:hypothetical protein|uniref:Uncharacterized protein n=1 Tax=Kuenenia stuttgartiensis TaxID=174633 RepID=Q1Q729_KUEST|nr:hypothetical protein KsCSTR_25730 [Candidatus Kuenenia stuttgartiensis]CAJ73384.1 unknown protein [Candidatus Kuenenia stuttgartiensis]SOH06480.1 hypothetical protein KSMBR1_4008 [Candidatus Kuenenia stuttgartiensis]